MTTELYEELELLFFWSYELEHYFNRDIKKMFTTQFSKKILKNFESKINSLTQPENGEPYFENDLRFVLFTGHDFNIFPFIDLMGLSSTKCLKLD